MPTIITADGTQLYYKDWGTGQPIVFSHGWPLTADAWEDQMVFLASHGYRCIAHDRRGHGRSGQPSSGHDMDTYADDLAQLVDSLELVDAIHIGHSTGGGEVTRYLARHRDRRVVKAVLISAVPPLVLKTPANPAGLPMELFDGIRAGMLSDRAQFFRDFAAPFYGANRSGAKVSQAVLDFFWSQCMQGGLNAEYECVAAFSETDFTADLQSITVPTLVLHGEEDQVVPVGHASRTAALLRDATVKIYPGLPHGMCSTHKDLINADLLAFLGAGVREHAA
jgi:non-heme chloroperoxidase